MEVALITNRSLASIALTVIVFLADTNTLPHLAPAALPAALLCNKLPDATTTAATTTAAADRRELLNQVDQVALDLQRGARQRRTRVRAAARAWAGAGAGAWLGLGCFAGVWQ